MQNSQAVVRSSIYDGADCQIDLSRDENSEVTEVWCGKGREYAKFGRLSFTLRDDGQWFKDQHCSEKLFLELHEESETKRDAQELTILSRMLETELIQNQLTDKTGMAKLTAIKLVKNCVTTGLVHERQNPKNKNSFLYSLTDSGYEKLGYKSKSEYMESIR